METYKTAATEITINCWKIHHTTSIHVQQNDAWFTSVQVNWIEQEWGPKTKEEVQKTAKYGSAECMEKFDK